MLLCSPSYHELQLKAHQSSLLFVVPIPKVVNSRNAQDMHRIKIVTVIRERRKDGPSVGSPPKWSHTARTELSLSQELH